VRKPVTLALAGLALLGLPVVPAGAAASDPLDGYRQVPGLGLARELPSGSFELFKDRGSGLVVHGHDTASMIPSLDRTQAQTFSATEPACVTSGTSYAHVIYAYPFDRASRHASMAEHIRDLVRDNTGRLVEEAGEFGASRKYRVLCNGSNQITVSNVGVGVASITDFNALTLDLENKGYNSNTVKYWVWFDGTTGPGILGTGHVYDNSSPSSSNPNNGGGSSQAMFAVLWGDEAGVPQYEATTWMHENGHNMGAVVSDAPNSSGNLHCTDDQDIMCYIDGGAQATCCFRSNVCTDREHFDCRHDDYFHPSPTSGFLTNHWNIGSTVNRFLDATSAITLRFALSAVSVNEDEGSVTLTVDRIGSTTGTVGVTASTSPGTASAGSDFTTTSTPLSFGPGVTTRTVTVPITSDGATGESSESFTVGLSAATGGATIGSPATTTVTIAESSGPPIVQFDASTLSVNEGTASAVFTVMRTGATGSAVSAQYATTDGTATSGSDYTATSGTVSFPSGVTSRTITVPLLDDQDFEPAETFTLTLSSPGGGAALGSRTTSTATIVETDARPTLSLTANAVQIGEDDGSLNVTVTRTGATGDAVDVTLATTPGTATADQDYTSLSTTLAFGAGVTTRSASIPILDDPAIESTEAFTVALSAPTGLGQLGSPASTLVTIVDDDGGVVTVGAATLASSETSPVTFNVNRTIPSAAASVDWRLSQISPLGGFTTGTLTFPAETSTRSVVANLNDTISTGDRIFAFTLSNATAMTLGSPATTTLRLTDDETAPTIGFELTSVLVQEDVGTRGVTLVRSGNVNAPTSVTLTLTGGTASTFTDLTATTGTISFTAGQVSRTIQVNVTDDVHPERAEDATLSLSQPSGATIANGTLAFVIAASDQQPDVIVQGVSPSPAGNNQYSESASSQRATALSPRVAGPGAATVLVENDGNAQNTITVFAAVPTSATELRYLIDGIDVTTPITSASGYEVSLAPLTRVTIRVEHLATPTTGPATQRAVPVRATWSGDGIRQDNGAIDFLTP
jgi:hypothetical protein